MVSKLGYGQRRLVEHIVKSNWNTDAPNSVKLKLNDVLFILQEMQDQEGMKYFDEEKSSNRGFYVFRNFAKHLLYRNLANYDSMILLTSEKGCLTDDTKIMMPRDLLKYPDGVPIKELINKGPIYVYSFNKETKKLELKKSDGVEFAKHADVYEIELVTGQKIKATEDHPFMLMDGSYKQLKDLVWLDKIKDKPGACFSRYRENSVWKYTDRLRMVITKPDVNDYLKVDYSPIKNGKNFYNKQIEYRFVLSQLGVDVNNKIVHHDDENHFNNTISNLKVMSQPEHIELHLKDYYFKQNNTSCQATGYSTKTKPKIKNGSDEFKELVSCQRKEYFSNKDNIEKYKSIMQTNGKHTNMYRYGGVIKSITFIGKQNVYDVVNVKDNKNFIANGFVVSNTGKSSAAVMLAREWCKLIGIRFDPKRHIAYNNADVMEKIDLLNKFEPLICLTGDARVKIRKNNIECEERIDTLVNMDDYEVLTYNIELGEYEYKTPEKTIKQPIKKAAYKIILENGTELKATENHLILTKNGYKKVCELTEDDEIKVFGLTYVKIKKIIEPKKKTDVYDILNIPDNHNFVANNIVVHNCDEAVRFACLEGDTLIKTSNGNVKIKDMVGMKNIELFSYNTKTKDVELKTAKECIKTKVDYVYEIETECGKKIKTTKEHKFLLTSGVWKTLEDLKEGDDLCDI